MQLMTAYMVALTILSSTPESYDDNFKAGLMFGTMATDESAWKWSQTGLDKFPLWKGGPVPVIAVQTNANDLDNWTRTISIGLMWRF